MRVFRCSVFLLGWMICAAVSAQNVLDRKISLTLEGQRLSTALSKIEEQGGFFFSYEARLLNVDSLVTLKSESQSIRAVLHLLFGNRFQYQESGKHIIIRKAVHEQRYITGSVVDASGPVEFASVYVKGQLAATLTDQEGRFKLKVKSLPAEVSASKMSYSDTSVIAHGPVVLYLEPKDVLLQEVRITASPIERSILSRWFVSRKLKMHSRNITQFFVNTPYQLSFFPGIGTQGKMATKSINKVSINMTGSYTSGTQGVELAGIFNLTQGDVRYAQVAGLFNLVDGDVKGAQMGGAYNQMHGQLQGVQAAGIGNYAKSGHYGVQLSGLFNLADSLKGTQVSGFYNSSVHLEGVQVAGAINRVRGGVQGVQVSGFLNVARDLQGVQVGIVNLAKRSSGYSIGLLNLVGNGNASLALFTSESSPWNLALKTGTPQLYSILSLSSSWEGGDPVPGIGVGREFNLFPKMKGLLEYTSYLSRDTYFRIQGLLVYPAHTPLRITAGPVLVYKGKSEGKMEGFTLTEKVALGGQIGLSWYFQKKS
jgi:hypothetical protein